MNDWTIPDWVAFLRVGRVSPAEWAALDPEARGRAVRAAVRNLEADARVHAALARAETVAPSLEARTDPREAVRTILREEARAGLADLRGARVRIGGRTPADGTPS